MVTFRRSLKQQGHEQGQALVEYGLIISLVAIVALVGLGVTGGGVDGLYGAIQTVARAMADRLS